MEKQYILKCGGFYISKIYLNENNPENDFLESLIFTSYKDRALIITKRIKADYLKKILYINGSIDCEIKEIGE